MTDGPMAANVAAGSAHPVVRKIVVADLKEALSQGFSDFWAAPTQLIFLCIIYPVVGAFLARAAAGYALLPLIYPLVTGFALIGPFAALGLYEISRRRERGLPASWINCFDVFRSPSLVSIALLGLLLLALFVAWLDAAHTIYRMIFGAMPPDSIADFVHQVTATGGGLTLFIIGNGVGFVFAALVLTLTVVSFPLLLDRPVGPIVAIGTSVRAVLANPLTMAVWGLIVAASLLAGALLLFVGLAIALPVLGHATWHLYRKVIAPE